MLAVGSIKQSKVRVSETVRKAFAYIGQVFIVGGECGVKFGDDVIKVEHCRVWIELSKGGSG